MKQLGNLAVVCAKRRDTLLQILDGTAIVHVGRGPNRTVLSANWQDDDRIMEFILELNHGRFREGTRSSGSYGTAIPCNGG